nr:hypothetical protein GCM10020093_027550 [Planobispora longispora]
MPAGAPIQSCTATTVPARPARDRPASARRTRPATRALKASSPAILAARRSTLGVRESLAWSLLAVVSRCSVTSPRRSIRGERPLRAVPYTVTGTPPRLRAAIMRSA